MDRFKMRQMPLPRSLAHLKREFSARKWADARRWAGGRVSGKKYRLLDKQRPDRTMAGSSKRLVSGLYQLKTDHCPTGQFLEPAHSQKLLAPVQDPDAGACLQNLPSLEVPAEDPVGGGSEGDWGRIPFGFPL